MVRRGSTVRVRQRASAYLLLIVLFRCLCGRRARFSASTDVPSAAAGVVGAAGRLVAASLATAIAATNPTRRNTTAHQDEAIGAVSMRFRPTTAPRQRARVVYARRS